MIAKPLKHAGIMPNYECTAACRHCLYACSPERTGGFMTETTMDEMYGLLREGGCRSVHIGGGEPFLDFDGLLTLIEKSVHYGIIVDYIETNGSWATDEDKIALQLSALKRVGGDTLCISIDPFHAEFVPYVNPLRLAKVCQKTDFGYFLWQERFLSTLQSVDPHTAHDRPELEKLLGNDYILKTANSYGIRMGGNAINIEQEYYKKKPLASVLNSTPCKGLVSTGHFHIDMFNRFIPPGCTGFVIPMEEVVRGITPGKYSVYEALLNGGVAALYNLAIANGFQPDKEYTSSCALCFFICKFLSEKSGFAELDAEHFAMSLRT